MPTLRLLALLALLQTACSAPAADLASPDAEVSATARRFEMVIETAVSSGACLSLASEIVSSPCSPAADPFDVRFSWREAIFVIAGAGGQVCRLSERFAGVRDVPSDGGCDDWEPSTVYSISSVEDGAGFLLTDSAGGRHRFRMSAFEDGGTTVRFTLEHLPR
jgi:hypothetical protein